jgi:allantoinase
LLLTDQDAKRLGAPAKCAPPLRTPRDGAGLRHVLDTEEISFIASDHSPAPISMKTTPNFFDVWGGVAGVQSTLQAMLSLEPPPDIETVGRMTASNAAKRFRLPLKGAVKVSLDADVTLVDLDRTFVLRREDLLDRHKLSPYVGRTFRGVIRRTILRGRTIFRDGKVVGPPAGRFVRPAR